MGPHVCLLSAMLLAATPPEVPAEAPEPDAATAAPADKIDPGVSPVELIPKIELRHLFLKPHGGEGVNITTTRIDIGFLGRLMVRYELPLQTSRSSGAQVSGLGDMRLQLVTLLTSGPRQVSVAMVGVVLDTASQAPLGAGRQQLLFGAAGALKPLPFWLSYLLVQEQLSVDSSESRPDVNLLIIRFGNLAFGPLGNWIKLDLDTTVNFIDDKGRFFGTLEAGSLVIGRVGLFIRSGTQLIGARQLDYTLETGVRYLFRLGKGKLRD